MTGDCQCVGEHDSVRDAARRLAELQAGAMPICGDDERLKGMVTDRDIAVKVVAQGKDPEATEVAELAQGTPIWVEVDADIAVEVPHRGDWIYLFTARTRPFVSGGIPFTAGFARRGASYFH
jgi:predicted transcriptional regulator